MALHKITLLVANPVKPGRFVTLQVAADPRSPLTALPRALLESIGIAAGEPKILVLAGGRQVAWPTGVVLATFRGVTMPISVALADAGHAPVLGAAELEILGFAVGTDEKLVPRAARA